MAEQVAHATVVSVSCSKDAVYPGINPKVLGKAGLPLTMAAQVFPGCQGNEGELIERYAYYVSEVAVMEVFEPVRQGPVPRDSGDWYLGRGGQLWAQKVGQWMLGSLFENDFTQIFPTERHEPPIDEDSYSYSNGLKVNTSTLCLIIDALPFLIALPTSFRIFLLCQTLSTSFYPSLLSVL